ncbi:hypothetical protein [Frankia sp. ACN1ag]|nr:hypothetical protein [Frankia sp. ACN1ag]
MPTSAVPTSAVPTSAVPTGASATACGRDDEPGLCAQPALDRLS